MTRFRFELAQPTDDAALRKLLADTPMAGRISLSFHREPSYFGANDVLGDENQTIVCRDLVEQRLVGLATRSVRHMFVDGAVRRVGYLSSLRSHPAVRNRGLLARGFRFLRRLHETDAAAPDFYLTTIAADNLATVELLTSGRAGLPKYHPLSSLHTLVVPRSSRGRNGLSDAPADCEISSATNWEEVVEFLTTAGPRKTFFPKYELVDFQSHSSTFRDLPLSSIAVAHREGQMVGVAGLWDQRSFRQTIIHDYSTTVRCLRPWLNLWGAVSGGVRLPEIGSTLAACFVAFPVVIDDDLNVFAALVRRLQQMAPANAEFQLLGLCDNDPLLPAARALSRSEYVTNVYAVNWSGVLPDVRAVNGGEHAGAGPYYLELGCL